MSSSDSIFDTFDLSSISVYHIFIFLAINTLLVWLIVGMCIMVNNIIVLVQNIGDLFLDAVWQSIVRKVRSVWVTLPVVGAWGGSSTPQQSSAASAEARRVSNSEPLPPVAARPLGVGNCVPGPPFPGVDDEPNANGANGFRVADYIPSATLMLAVGAAAVMARRFTRRPKPARESFAAAVRSYGDLLGDFTIGVAMWRIAYPSDLGERLEVLSTITDSIADGAIFTQEFWIERLRRFKSLSRAEQVALSIAGATTVYALTPGSKLRYKRPLRFHHLRRSLSRPEHPVALTEPVWMAHGFGDIRAPVPENIDPNEAPNVWLHSAQARAVGIEAATFQELDRRGGGDFSLIVENMSPERVAFLVATVGPLGRISEDEGGTPVYAAIPRGYASQYLQDLVWGAGPRPPMDLVQDEAIFRSEDWDQRDASLQALRSICRDDVPTPAEQLAEERLRDERQRRGFYPSSRRALGKASASRRKGKSVYTDQRFGQTLVDLYENTDDHEEGKFVDPPGEPLREAKSKGKGRGKNKGRSGAIKTGARVGRAYFRAYAANAFATSKPLRYDIMNVDIDDPNYAGHVRDLVRKSTREDPNGGILYDNFQLVYQAYMEDPEDWANEFEYANPDFLDEVDHRDRDWQEADFDEYRRREGFVIRFRESFAGAVTPLTDEEIVRLANERYDNEVALAEENRTKRISKSILRRDNRAENDANAALAAEARAAKAALKEQQTKAREAEVLIAREKRAREKAEKAAKHQQRMAEQAAEKSRKVQAALAKAKRTNARASSGAKTPVDARSAPANRPTTGGSTRESYSVHGTVPRSASKCAGPVRANDGTAIGRYVVAEGGIVVLQRHFFYDDESVPRDVNLVTVDDRELKVTFADAIDRELFTPNSELVFYPTQAQTGRAHVKFAFSQDVSPGQTVVTVTTRGTAASTVQDVTPDGADLVLWSRCDTAQGDCGSPVYVNGKLVGVHALGRGAAGSAGALLLSPDHFKLLSLK